MATAYNVFTTGSDPVASRAKKDAAIKHGETLGVDFRVVTDSGKLVHEAKVVPGDDFEYDGPEGVAPKDDEVEDLIGTPEPEPVVEPKAKAKKAPAKKAAAKKATSKKAPKDTEPEPVQDPIMEDTDPASDDELDELIGEVKEGKGERKFDSASMKRKIVGLLAKAEGTDNEHERATFTAAAHRLMLKLGIDMAELEADGKLKAESIVNVERPYASVYARNMVNFLHNVSIGFGGITVIESGRWAKATAHIVGHKTDVELFMKLADSLDIQVMSALNAWQKSHKAERAGMNNYDRLIGSRSFLAGYSVTVRERLAARREQAVTEASEGGALVLVTKAEKVATFVEENYKTRPSKSGTARYSARAAAAGREAGEKADLGEKSVEA